MKIASMKIASMKIASMKIASMKIASILPAPFLLSLLSGLLFVLIFSFFPVLIPWVSDDGVITMSHGRNLVDYGFIGINPSGGRVEGYSAPLQFFLYTAAYAMTGVGYATYSKAQTYIATFLLGALLVLFFLERKILAIAVVGVAAVFLTSLRPFLGWHFSGMDNAVTHVLFWASVLIFFFMTREKRINYYLSIPVFLASISRTESIYHIGPLLILFGAFYLVAYPGRDWRGVWFSLLVLGLWALFQLWRYLYFGDLLPNTSYAQDITVIANLRPYLALDWEHIRLAIIRSKDMLNFQGGYTLLMTLPALLVLSRRRETILLVLLLGSLAMTALFNESIFGQARIERPRIITHLSVFSALGTATLLYNLLRYRRMRWATPAVAVVGILVFLMDVGTPYTPEYYFATYSDNDRKRFIRFLEPELLPRPTVSNPDLGAMSWHKQFNVIDLGLIGSPMMAKLPSSAWTDYFLYYATPDIIAIHGSWTCKYRTEILNQPRFGEIYQPLAIGSDSHTRANCEAEQSGIWIRSDILRSSGSAERQLIDLLKTELSVELLREELERCQSLTTRLYDCVYVARTAYRFLPEFRAQGEVDALDEIFATSRTAPFDRYLINGYRDGQAHRDAIDFIVERGGGGGGGVPCADRSNRLFCNQIEPHPNPEMGDINPGFRGGQGVGF